MVKPENALLRTKPLTIQGLYEAYAGMLLGYIFEVVNDRLLAEEYLVKTFGTIHTSFDKIDWDETNSWCQLQRFAKQELVTFNDSIKNNLVNNPKKPIGSLPNRYLDRMTELQKLVFCNIYYSKKTTTELAREINRPETLVKRTLKEAFAIIRDRNED